MALGCVAELRQLDKIARLGTSADTQLALYQRAREAGQSRDEALRDVLSWLADATVADADLPYASGRTPARRSQLASLAANA